MQPFSFCQASRTRAPTSNCQTAVCATTAEAINDFLLLPFHLPKCVRQSVGVIRLHTLRPA